jgi:ABC-type antimicrobial peptide transport system permease subunit
MALLPAVKRAIWSINPQQYVPDTNVTLEGHLDAMVAERRFSMALLSMLGVLALVIAAAGVYGVMAYMVSQRRQEIGVRMALGARPNDVLRMVMRHTGVLVFSGLAIGSVAAWALSETVRRFLFLIAPTDWRVVAIAAGLLALSAAVACLIPARRAARIDPLIALRAD